MTATIKCVARVMLCSVLVIPLTIQAQTREDEEPSCTQIDFDDETLTSLSKCGYLQEFTAKPYDESTQFDPYRPGANHYLSNEWQGTTCGKTVRTYSFNSDTELRMAYNAVFESGAFLEVRVYDLDRVDSTGNAIVVEFWQTQSSTEDWGFFREKLNKTVIRAQIQIEANMNAGSDLAIEYLTIFNYEVETEECSAIDEFLTTTEIPTTTTESSTTAFPATTTTTATTAKTTTTGITTTTDPTTSTTMLSTETEEITIPTTEVSEELPTTTSEATTSTSETTPTTTAEALTTITTPIPTTTIISSTTTTTSTSIPITTRTTTTVKTTEFTTTTSSTPTATAPSTTTSTTTNAPRDDTSMLPTSSSTIEQTSTTVDSVESSNQSTTTPISQTLPSHIFPPVQDLVGSNQWMWMTLAAMFGTLLLLATSAVFYLWYANQHLDRMMMRLLDELCYEKYKENPLKII